VHDGFYLWLTPKGGALVAQSTIDVVTPQWVDAFQDQIDSVIRQGLMQAFPGLTLLYDWRSLTQLPADGRERWLQRAGRPGMPFQGASAGFVALSAIPVLRMVVQAWALSAAYSSGLPSTEIVDDPATVLRAREIEAPPVSFFDEWRARES
jgi:hypothetical protein